MSKRKIKCTISYVARKNIGDKSNRPVEIIPQSFQSPVWDGESYGWETKGGSVIHYPSAYSKVGWSNMVYKHSTLKIRVGEFWARIEIVKNYPNLINL